MTLPTCDLFIMHFLLFHVFVSVFTGLKILHVQIKKRRAYSRLSTVQQTIKYFTHLLLLLLGLKLLASK